MIKPRYSFDSKRCLKFVLFGCAGWLPAMAGIILLAWGSVPPALSLGLGLAGGLAILALSLFRSREKLEPVFRLSDVSRLNGRQWSDVANPEGNFASRWTMYEDLTGWLSEHQWHGKVVAEIGGSNEALRSFIPSADFRPLPYPEYDVQDLRQISDNEFDIVILDQTLEHLADPERALREIRRVLKPGGVALITTPFLTPVHPGANFGDYYRWTPQGMETMLKRCGFDPRVSAWGNLKAATALTEDMYMRVDRARQLGLDLSRSEPDNRFPVTVWATARSLKD